MSLEQNACTYTVSYYLNAHAWTTLPVSIDQCRCCVFEVVVHFIYLLIKSQIIFMNKYVFRCCTGSLQQIGSWNFSHSVYLGIGVIFSPKMDHGHIGPQAYVALLHGQRAEYFRNALLLGFNLLGLDNVTPRVLLIGKCLPQYPSPYSQGVYLRCLERFWTIRKCDLIDCAAADKSYAKRHRYVFTKLRSL
jgi:hypothetical protein